MHIHESGIMDSHNSELWISIIRNYGYPPIGIMDIRILNLWISINRIWKSINRIMDIHNRNYGYPQLIMDIHHYMECQRGQNPIIMDIHNQLWISIIMGFCPLWHSIDVSLVIGPGG